MASHSRNRALQVPAGRSAKRLPRTRSHPRACDGSTMAWDCDSALGVLRDSTLAGVVVAVTGSVCGSAIIYLFPAAMWLATERKAVAAGAPTTDAATAPRDPNRHAK